MLHEKRLEYLLTVFQEQNITAAAEKLYVSQPALSRMIRDIEEEIGTEIFIRNRGKMELTQTGKIFIDGCLKLDTVYQATLKKIQECKKGISGTLHLGIPPVMSSVLLPQLLPDFRRAYPEITPVLHEQRNSMLAEMVVNRTIDIAFLYESDFEKSENLLTVFPLADEEIYLQVPPSFAAAAENTSRISYHSGHKILSVKTLEGQNVILMKKGRGLRKAADYVLKEAAVKIRPVIETESVDVAHALVLADEGFAFISNLARMHYGKYDEGIYYRLKEKLILRKLCMICRNDDYITDSVYYLMNLVKHILGNE